VGGWVLGCGLATILMYLNDVEDGGETVFPHPSAEWMTAADPAAGGGSATGSGRGRGTVLGA